MSSTMFLLLIRRALASAYRGCLERAPSSGLVVSPARPICASAGKPLSYTGGEDGYARQKFDYGKRIQGRVYDARLPRYAIIS